LEKFTWWNAIFYGFNLMYNIQYSEVYPEGYIDKTLRFDSFTNAIKIFKQLQTNPFIDVIIFRENARTMMYIK
jgi:hypothetical protein